MPLPFDLDGKGKNSNDQTQTYLHSELSVTAPRLKSYSLVKIRITYNIIKTDMFNYMPTLALKSFCIQYSKCLPRMHLSIPNGVE